MDGAGEGPGRPDRHPRNYALYFNLPHPDLTRTGRRYGRPAQLGQRAAELEARVATLEAQER